MKWFFNITISTVDGRFSHCVDCEFVFFVFTIFLTKSENNSCKDRSLFVVVDVAKFFGYKFACFFFQAFI